MRCPNRCLRSVRLLYPSSCSATYIHTMLYLLQLVAIHSLSEMMRFGARSCVRSEHRATSVCERASERQWHSCADETGTLVLIIWGVEPRPLHGQRDRKHGIGSAANKLMKEMPSSKLVVRVLVKKFITCTWKLEFYCWTNKHPPLNPILNIMNSAQTVFLFFF